MVKVFFTPLRDQKKRLFIYETLFSGEEKFLFKPRSGFSYDFQVVPRIEDADVAIESSPVTRGSERSWKPYPVPAGMPYIVQVGGDLSHDIFLDGPTVLKVSQYRSLKRDNETIMPPFCEDLGAIHGFVPRQKSAKAVVSFCGWAGFSGMGEYIKYCIKTFIFHPFGGVFRKGIYFRRKSLKVLGNSKLVDTSFIVRDTFSGSADTISLDPARARDEYVKNMIDSDFVLAPKGDANYSVRFFEALSLGRVPILIDTETCLPFEDRTDYSKCIVKVPYKDIGRLPRIVSDFYAALSPEAWADMQKEARRIFESYLKYDSYWNGLLKSIVK